MAQRSLGPFDQAGRSKCSWLAIFFVVSFLSIMVDAQNVKGGVKVDHWGGVKLDQLSM